ncbi:MAG: hypothetical protein WC749_10065 [Dehalococcoidia bacterium]
MTNKRQAMTDVLLKEQLSYSDKLAQGSSFIENNAFFVLGESGGNDIIMVSCIFRCGGGRQGTWQVADTGIGQTNLLVVPQDQRGKMHDNDFIGNRVFPTEWSGDAKITQTESAVTWELGKRQYICRPPYWEIKGEHMGVECNLTLGGLGNATRCFGNWDDLATIGQAGYQQALWAKGTITKGNTTYNLEKGYAFQEKLTLTWDLAELFRDNPLYLIWLWSESVRICIFNVPAMGFTFSQVIVDGQEVSFDQGKVIIDEMDWWTDPKTQLRVPIRWHLNMNSPNGVVDMMMSAGARVFYPYLTRTGIYQQYAFLVRSEGRLFLPEGRSIPLNSMAIVEKGWCTMPLPAGAQ